MTGGSDRARVALTFDAEHGDYPGGADEQYGHLLDTLQSAGVRATFFVQGRWARAWPAVARRIADDGHLVGLHCNSHVPYPWLTPEGVARDIEVGRGAVAEACGVDPAPWFRLPYGKGAADVALLDQLRTAGFENVHWSVDSRDWAPESEPDGVVDRVCAAPGDPEVVLFHIWPPTTARILPEVLARLADVPVDLVTADTLHPDERARLHPRLRVS